MDTVKDELLQHREGQHRFTRGRIIFAMALGIAVAGLIAWWMLGSE